MAETFVQANPYPWPYNGRLDKSNTALVVIDMQTDFCGPGGYVEDDPSAAAAAPVPAAGHNEGEDDSGDDAQRQQERRRKAARRELSFVPVRAACLLGRVFEIRSRAASAPDRAPIRQ